MERFINYLKYVYQDWLSYLVTLFMIGFVVMGDHIVIRLMMIFVAASFYGINYIFFCHEENIQKRKDKHK